MAMVTQRFISSDAGFLAVAVVITEALMRKTEMKVVQLFTCHYKIAAFKKGLRMVKASSL